MTELLQVPTVIKQCIAEYATGILTKCCNELCDTDILILTKEWKYFDDETNRWISAHHDLNYLCPKCVTFMRIKVMRRWKRRTI